MCSHSCRGRRPVGRERNPEGCQCWWWESWMWVCPASLAAACLSGSWWSTDRWRWAQRAVSVCLREGQAWWYWRPSWSPQIRSLRNSQVCQSVAGCNSVPYWQRHPQTCLLCRQTEEDPARVQWCPSGRPGPVSQVISWPQTLEPQVCSR